MATQNYKTTMFAKKTKQRVNTTMLDNLVDSIKGHIQDSGVSSQQSARAALSMESLDSSMINVLSTARDNLGTALESIAQEHKFSDKFSQAQRDAGMVAGILAGDVNSFMQHPVQHQMVATEGINYVTSVGVADAFTKRTLGMEAYDEKDNRNVVAYSIAYNMQAARQDEFGETFFPTIVVTPDNVGFGITIRLYQVYEDFLRQTSGALTNYNKRNIIRAIADPTILKNEQTKIVPVYRVDSAHNFVSDAIIPHRTILLEGEPIATSPLAVGKKIDLLAISQTDVLLANGMMDPSDSIEPAVVLGGIYVKIGNDILYFNTQHLPLSTFMAVPQNLHRLMNLAFTTNSLLLTANTKQVDGTALVSLSSVVTNNLIVRLGVNVTGSVNLEQGDTVVHGNSLEVSVVQNSSGELVALNAAPAAALVTLLETATVLGYDLVAYRTNLNRRQRGQLVDTTFYTQMYSVPLRGPITCLRPINTDGQTDSTDLNGLLLTTHVRTSNASVTALLQTATILNEYVDARDTAGVGPDLLGVGRFLVRPAFHSSEIDMLTAVDSIKSHERAKDIQAVLVNKLRDVMYRLYRDSEYKAASDAMQGPGSKAPTVIIGTDPVIARYLMIEGDFRTLGGEFDVRIVSTLDNRMKGRIIATFGVFDGSENTPNPLHFGNMAWKPELTLVLPMPRNGAISKELTVQPSFLHLVNLPIMAVIDVLNVPDVVASKIPLYFHTV